MQNEILLFDIPDFEGLYKISKKGHVFNVLKNQFMKPHFSGVKRRNYYQITLYKKGKKHTKRIHSLMAITFLDHKYGDRKIVIDHVDNNPLNNDLNNLAIVSMAYNNTKDRKTNYKLN